MRASSVAPERWDRQPVEELAARLAQDRRALGGQDWQAPFPASDFDADAHAGWGFSMHSRPDRASLHLGP